MGYTQWLSSDILWDVHPCTWLPLSSHSENLDVVPVDFRTDWILAFSAICELLSVVLYGYEELDMIVYKALCPFVLCQKMVKASYSSRSSTFLSTMSEWVEVLGCDFTLIGHFYVGLKKVLWGWIYFLGITWDPISLCF